MTTAWYFHCTECDEWSRYVGQSSARRPEPYLIVDLDNREYEASRFVIKHQGHLIRYVSEYTRWPEDCPWSMTKDEQETNRESHTRRP